MTVRDRFIFDCRLLMWIMAAFAIIAAASSVHAFGWRSLAASVVIAVCSEFHGEVWMWIKREGR